VATFSSAADHGGDTGFVAGFVGFTGLGGLAMKDLPLPPADKLWTLLRVRPEQELKDKGFAVLAGPFKECEAGMLRSVVLDADRQERHLGYSESEQGEVYVWQK
jgi:hypothetical protein